MTLQTKPSVLSGVRVLDFGHYIAALRYWGNIMRACSRRYLGLSTDRLAVLTQSGVLVQEPLVKELGQRGEIT